MKKYQGLSLNIINTIIIAAIILVVLIVLWAIFTGRMSAISPIFIVNKSNEIILEKQDFVCQNLEKNGTVYWEIINTHNEIEKNYAMVVKDMDGTKIVAKTWDNYGVTCKLPAEGCFNGWCFDIEMIIPVNYTEWKMWYDEK